MGSACALAGRRAGLEAGDVVELVPGKGVVGFELERRLIGLLGFVETVQLGQGVAAVAQHQRAVLRREIGDRQAARRAGQLVVPAMAERPAPRRVRRSGSATSGRRPDPGRAPRALVPTVRSRCSRSPDRRRRLGMDCRGRRSDPCAWARSAAGIRRRRRTQPSSRLDRLAHPLKCSAARMGSAYAQPLSAGPPRDPLSPEFRDLLRRTSPRGWRPRPDRR